ncbi:MAG: TRAM domain-containing protein [Nanoarchaeota archaeon]|nr:TRAM domain-containing protein [Nanoarchaeota archaeon]MBU1322069.1 TRAM domain-containing protein [Nanoarchaeota archaeon]MBU1598175.1 TRAM domain-containing protein [Nanoarchaeota archaeon]MBU2441305.1 TRAM domain-containing protein [Nanoarchaeota archaeon]
MFEQRRRFAPVREGDELDVRIEAVGEKGDGIAKTQGFVLFIPNTKEGDEVRVKVTRVLRSAGFAEVIGSAKAAPAASAKQKEAVVEDKSEEEVAELEEAAESMDSEDFGDDDGAEDEPAEEEAPEDEPEEEPSDEDSDEEPEAEQEAEKADEDNTDDDSDKESKK